MVLYESGWCVWSVNLHDWRELVYPGAPTSTLVYTELQRISYYGRSAGSNDVAVGSGGGASFSNDILQESYIAPRIQG
jgi:hypothetical protein